MTERHAPSEGEWIRDPAADRATADAHAHTTRSDGVLEPDELVRQAVDAGVRLFSITDHDNLAGYRERRRPPALPPASTSSRASRSTPSRAASASRSRAASSTCWGWAWIPTTRRSRRRWPASGLRGAPASTPPCSACATRASAWTRQVAALDLTARRRARPAHRGPRPDRGRVRRRASRTRSSGSSATACRGTSRARGSGRSTRSTRSGRPAGSPRWRTSRRRPRTHRSCATSSTRG